MHRILRARPVALPLLASALLHAAVLILAPTRPAPQRAVSPTRPVHTLVVRTLSATLVATAAPVAQPGENTNANAWREPARARARPLASPAPAQPASEAAEAADATNPPQPMPIAAPALPPAWGARSSWATARPGFSPTTGAAALARQAQMAMLNQQAHLNQQAQAAARGQYDALQQKEQPADKALMLASTGESPTDVTQHATWINEIIEQEREDIEQARRE